MRTRLLIALVETVGAAFIAYQQMPSDQQQRIRMIAYKRGMTVCERVAFKVGQFGIRLERKYAEEGAGNG